MAAVVMAALVGYLLAHGWWRSRHADAGTRWPFLITAVVFAMAEVATGLTGGRFLLLPCVFLLVHVGLHIDRRRAAAALGAMTVLFGRGLAARTPVLTAEGSEVYADPDQTDSASSTTRPGHVPLFERLWMQVVVVIACAVFLSAVRLRYYGPASLDHDEATIGVMALRDLEGDVSFFFPAQPYNGGAVMEALVLAPFVAALGPTFGAMVAASGVFVALLLLMVVLATRSLVGPSRALWPILLITLASVRTAYYLMALGGYTISMALMVLVLWQAIAWRRTGRGLHGWIAGFAWGISVWAHYYGLLLLPAFLVVALAGREHRRRRLRSALLGMAVGLLPLVIYNLTHRFGNVGFLIQRVTERESDGADTAGRTVEGLRQAAYFVAPHPVAAAVILAGLAYLVVHVLRARKGDAPTRWAFLATGLTFALVIFGAGEVGGRRLAFVPLFLLVQVCLFIDWRRALPALVVLGACFVWGLVGRSSYGLVGASFALEDVTREFVDRDVRRVYAPSQFQYHLQYLSGNRIEATAHLFRRDVVDRERGGRFGGIESFSRPGPAGILIYDHREDMHADVQALINAHEVIESRKVVVRQASFSQTTLAFIVIRQGE